jgi:hypothetical protein
MKVIALIAICIVGLPGLAQDTSRPQMTTPEPTVCSIDSKPECVGNAIGVRCEDMDKPGHFGICSAKGADRVCECTYK